MEYLCFSCSQPVKVENPTNVGRKDICDNCTADLHCCLNCEFHDTSCYNECREPQSERVLDKDRSNFCDYFKFRSGKPKARKTVSDKDSTLKKLDDLFKK